MILWNTGPPTQICSRHYSAAPSDSINSCGNATSSNRLSISQDLIEDYTKKRQEGRQKETDGGQHGHNDQQEGKQEEGQEERQKKTEERQNGHNPQQEGKQEGRQKGTKGKQHGHNDPGWKARGR